MTDTKDVPSTPESFNERILDEIKKMDEKLAQSMPAKFLEVFDCHINTIQYGFKSALISAIYGDKSQLNYAMGKLDLTANGAISAVRKACRGVFEDMENQRKNH